VHKLLIVLWFSVVVTGCDGGFCNDSEGLGPGLIVLRNDGFVIPTVYGALGSTPERVFPYEGESPFLKCRAIGTLSFRHPDAVLDSDHYPELESLGGLGVEVDDDIEAIEGFDGVIAFGGVGNPFGYAKISRIDGFNSVEHITGSIESSAVLSGFQALRELDGSLQVASIPGLQLLERVGGSWTSKSRLEAGLLVRNLREVGGNLTIERSQLQELGFPALTHVGGNLIIDGNSSLRTWSGLAQGSTVDGNFEGTFNSPILDETFEAWLDSGATTVAGTSRICANGPIIEGEERSCSEL
jgi:hypothetical protein